MAEKIVKLGPTVATPGALAACEASGDDPADFVRRHEAGDWGTVPEDHARQNAAMVKEGGMVMSAFKLKDGTDIWVITDPQDEAGVPTATTLLLPADMRNTDKIQLKS
jgi:hypothetical protein